MAKKKKIPLDIHWLYEASVQNVDTDLDIGKRIFSKHRKRKPLTVRDFRVAPPTGVQEAGAVEALPGERAGLARGGRGRGFIVRRGQKRARPRGSAAP